MGRETGTLTFEEWVRYVFDRPVMEPRWYWQEDEQADDYNWWIPGSITIAIYLAELFEASGSLLRQYSPDQISQGLYFIFTWISGYFHDASGPSVPPELQERWIRAVYIVYRDSLQPICSREYVLDPPPASADWTCTRIAAQMPSATPTSIAVSLSVLEQILALDCPMCQDAALYGLGHMHYSAKEEVGRIIDRYLERRPNLNVHLRQHAEQATVGKFM